MKFVSNNNITDPTINLAMEEYVLKHLPSDDSYFSILCKWTVYHCRKKIKIL